MMGTKLRSFAPLPDDLSLEDLVPEDNFYRRLEARLDLSFVRDLVGPLYANGGRPSVDPVVFFKLQLVMFFEDICSERQLMGVVSDRLSFRWYLGYDLHEPLPDHSSLTRIRERYGLLVFRHFFERIVEECIEAGLVWGEELFFDATKVEANASMESRVPRFSAEAHLGELFGDEEGAVETEAADETSEPYADADLNSLPPASDRGLRAENAKRDDWISREGKPDRTIVRNGYRRKSDYELCTTDLDASLMQHKRGATRLGYHAHHVVDGGLQIRHQGGSMVGFEALLRWRHPHEGIQRPSAFLPLAEETDLIVPMDGWVLDEVCRQAKRWERDYPCASLVTMNVNLSPRNLKGGGLARTIEETLKRVALKVRTLALDITEGFLLKASEDQARTLDALKKMGIRLDLDDFGTGYSSLSYLKNFPVDGVKLDKSFVEGLAEDTAGMALVRKFIELCHTLGLEVLAEGIETPEQATLLKEMGCDLGQGYYFGRLLPSEEFAERLPAVFLA